MKKFMQLRKETGYCVECGEAEEDHCNYSPVTVPVDCECDSSDWSEDITDICDNFFDIGGGECDCGHTLECHQNRVLRPDPNQLALPLK